MNHHYSGQALIPQKTHNMLDSSENKSESIGSKHNSDKTPYIEKSLNSADIEMLYEVDPGSRIEEKKLYEFVHDVSIQDERDTKQFVKNLIRMDLVEEARKVLEQYNDRENLALQQFRESTNRKQEEVKEMRNKLGLGWNKPQVEEELPNNSRLVSGNNQNNRYGSNNVFVEKIEIDNSINCCSCQCTIY